MNNKNFIKKILNKIKENFMSDDIREEIRMELIDPIFIEIRNFILPHYIIFIILLSTIMILIIYLILIIHKINYYKIIS